jgi:hypothetical protein
MARFKFKLTLDNDTIIKANAERFNDFSPLFNDLKKKFSDKKERRK